MRWVGLGLGLALLAATAANAAPARWVASWAASPVPPMVAPPSGPMRDLASPSFDNQTVVQVVRLSAGGARVRVRFTNEYGTAALKIGRASVALAGPEGAALPGTTRELRFSGAPGAVVPPKAPLLSDPVDLRVPSLAKLRISLYLPEATGLCPCHAGGQALAQISPPGDYLDRPFKPVGTTQNRVFLSGVEVDSPARAPVIVAFGDSITDGYLSSLDANHRWPDRLAERLGGHAAVVNAGIGGNRVISTGSIAIFGESALSRLDRDVLAQPGATHLIVLEGINDIGARPTPTLEALIAGFRQVIARAHAHGLKVILGTIAPYKGAAYFRPDGEVTRLAVNRWIRTGGEADGMIDFDAAIRDPADPARIRADLQSGDWLHPNDAGYRAMGDAVPLGLFR